MASSTQDRRSALPIALLLLAALVGCAVVLASASAADPTEATTFGADGVATQSLGVSLAETSYESVVARPDGGLLVRQGAQVVALLANGAPDPTFAPIPAKTEGSGLFPAAGGKAFVVDETKVTRLGPDGAADPSFGQDGTSHLPHFVRAAGELGSGKVVAVSVEQFSPKNPGVYIGTQVLDQHGKPSGPEVRSGSSGEYYFGKAIDEVVPAPDGGALIVGSSAMFRLRADGSRDPRFGHNGLVPDVDGLVGARFLPDGSIEAIVSDYIDATKRKVPAVFRFTANGDPDRSFGEDGVKLLDLPEWDEVGAVLWGADGSAVIGGRFEVGRPPCSGDGCEEGPVVAALDPAGDPEPGFGDGGQIRFAALTDSPQEPGGETKGVRGLVLRPDGSIVAAGGAPPNATVAFAAAFSTQGALLPSFGEGGLVRVSEPLPAGQKVAGIVYLPDGKLLAAGTNDVGPGRQAVLVRYAADGSLDPSFGGGTGYVKLAGGLREPDGFAVRGELALVGLAGLHRGSLALVGTSDGSPVASFGHGGRVGLQNGAFARALAFASDGDPVVLDSVAPTGKVEEPFVIQRFGEDGGPDRSFGDGGRVVLRLPRVARLKLDDLVAGPGGRTFLGGFAREDFVVACLRPDGRLDPRFGSGGLATLKAAGKPGPVTLRWQDRRLYLAGTTKGQHGRRVVLARFDAHGRLDRGFGHGGTRSAALKVFAHPTTILPTRAGAVVVLDQGPRPVITFAGHGIVQQPPIGAEGPVEDVRATAGSGRLIVGWSPRSVGRGYSPDYHLSAGPLEP